jgi:hypothetical protein
VTAPYAVRRINLTFQLGKGSFGETGSDQLTFTGLRVAVQIQLAALPTTGAALIRVYGMTLSQMNQLSKAGLVWKGRQDKVQVSAGDDISGMSVIFNGLIIEAYPDFTEAPNSAFSIFATPTQTIQLKPVPPSTFPGSVKVADVLEKMAKAAGLGFENNGVDTVLASPYFPGTMWQQINSAVRAANINSTIDNVKNALVIWPKSSSRSGGEVTISPENGMIGYPTFEQTRVKVRTIFDPEVKLTGTGLKVKIKSQLTAADGEFTVTTINYNLASETPGGPWEMALDCSPLGQ